MIEVEVNGVIHEFPEGTSRDVIRQALQRKYGGPSNTRSSMQQESQTQQKPGIGRTVFDQTMQGATFGFADEVQDAIGAGIASIATGENLGDMYNQARELSQSRLDEQLQQRPATAITSNLVGGVGTGIAGGATKAGTAVGNFLRTGNTAARAAKGAAAGAATGAAYGAGTGQDGDRARSAGMGAVTGGVVGAAAPVAGAAVRGAYNTIVPKIDDAVKPLAKRARDFGIPLRADQVAPSMARNTVQKASQVMPLSGSTQFIQKQRSSWNKALANTIGVDDLSPGSIKTFRRRNSDLFDEVLKNKQVQFADNDISKIASLKGQIDETLGLTDRDAKILTREVDGLIEDLSDKIVSGEKLSNLRSNLLEKATRAGRGSRVFDEAIATLDEVAAKNSTAEEVAKLGTARQQYKRFKIMQPLLEESTDGEINPTRLLNRVKSNRYIDASTIETGQDDLVDLARIGKEFLPIKGGSDTFDKSALAALGFGGFVDPLTALAVGTGLGVNRGLQGVVSNQALIDAGIRAGTRAPSKIYNTPLTALVAPAITAQ